MEWLFAGGWWQISRKVPNVLRRPHKDPLLSSLSPALAYEGADKTPSLEQKASEQRKRELIRTARHAAFFTGAGNYAATELISTRDESVSHIAGPVYRMGIGLADHVLWKNDISLRDQHSSKFIVPGIRTVSFWLFGAFISGYATRYPKDRILVAYSKWAHYR